jgi:pimeloyl-ACP methyl ester carboxylesterase
VISLSSACCHLLQALLERPQGSRPVTLVGYSLGCRVIFECLKELAACLAELESGANLPVAVAELDNPGIPGSAQRSGACRPEVQPRAPRTKAAKSSAKGYFSFGGMFGTASGASAVGDVGQADAEASKDRNADVVGSNAATTAREVKSIVKDVVLLGAPLNLKV